MKSYYFEPLNTYASEFWVKSNIGSVFLEYSPDRQREIGLYESYHDTAPPYNPYSESPDGHTWTRFANLDELYSADPLLARRLFNDRDYGEPHDYPFYVQVWNIVPLTGDALTYQTDQARLKVTTEVARLLASVSGYANKNGCPDCITNYSAALLDLTNQPSYPHQLAYDAQNGTWAAWPGYPDLSPALEHIAAAPVATTNADTAFTRILNAYSIPGSYPEKVAAITAAVAVYGVDGSVTDLYNHAVATLSD